MEAETIIKIIDEFFDMAQLEVNSHVEQFGNYGNRDIDGREKSMLLMMPEGYRNKLKKRFAILGEKE